VAAAERLDAGDATAVTDPTAAASLVRAARACLVADRGATTEPVAVLVERELALVSAWYELFPRSWGPEPGVHGTLADVEAHLDEVAAMGFDILYLPPVHPIGTAHRKGPDNSETAGPGDPGSPWAIGSPEGGHTAVHPELGTVDDVASLARACRDAGLELALDIALQCSPDHPWVTEHPSWFRHRPDGTIQYAENPPKKYQDIYPLDFESPDWRELWAACRDVFLFWAERGVSVFRVDNPHTKPFPFWSWCLEEVRRRHPDVVFLSEAFTRPEPMHGLAALGFTQSYAYFPWRVGRAELADYLTEVAGAPSVDRLRPSFWPNTPDILPWHLQGASRRQFALRVALAATMSPSYGIYGPAFELCESTPAGNGKEEYARSEKYELRWWDRDDPASLRGFVTTLNRLRRDQLALRTLRTARVHDADDDALLVFSKTAHAGPCVDPARPGEATVVVVANLHDHEVRAGRCTLDLAALGVDPERPYQAHDLLSGETWTWQGPRPYVELHPERAPLHILRITQP
jgi:starch synthase (maltosyl-transferring)